MITYIAILRGINVGGHRKLPMAALRELLNDLGLSEVKTYIQSGNLIFKSKNTNIKSLEVAIEQAIKKQFNYEVPTLIREVSAWERAFSNNPYKDKDPKKVSFTFLSDTPEEKLESFISDYDEFIHIDDVVHVYCQNGYRKSKLHNNFFEKKLNVKATTRNWNTVNKLLTMAKE
ncbi:MAG: DUF1697 domain-containing protein [Flavobacteriaceae bacterium]|nr:DUF1697 domain-containing protein [Flavobacteriaceae bacterium]